MCRVSVREWSLARAISNRSIASVATSSPMRLLIADDHPLFRDGLRSLLEARGVDVVGEATNGREAVEQARRLRRMCC